MGCSVKPGEDKQKFISRCISTGIKDGKNKEDAAGMCYGIWDEAKKSEAKNNLTEIKKSLGMK